MVNLFCGVGMGFRGIVNNEVTAVAVFRFSVALACISAACAFYFITQSRETYMLQHQKDPLPDNFEYAIVVLSFIVCFQLSETLLAPISAATTTIYVAFADDPEALQVRKDIPCTRLDC